MSHSKGKSGSGPKPAAKPPTPRVTTQVGNVGDSKGGGRSGSFLQVKPTQPIPVTPKLPGKR